MPWRPAAEMRDGPVQVDAAAGVPPAAVPLPAMADDLVLGHWAVEGTFGLPLHR